MLDLYTTRCNISNGLSIRDLNLRVCFYARVSTDKDEQLHSLEHQTSFFEEYIKSNSNWTFIDSYIDQGISGTSIKNRDNFLRMINDAKNDNFDLILTKEISRFSRNTLDSIKYTTLLLSYGVGVYFLNDNINTILPDSELRLTIMSSIAQDEVRKLSERVSFGMKRSIEKGVVLGSSNIYGYIKDKGKLIIDENEKEIIKIIFDRYTKTNDGLNKISNYLYNLGYKNKTNKKISPTILTRIIKNPKYMGYYCGNKTRVVDYRTKEKRFLDNREWIMYRDYKNVPPIVSEEVWHLANEKLKRREESFKSKNIDKNIFKNRYTYSAKIYCKKHNLTYHRSASGKRINNPVWECQVYRKEGLKGCESPRIFEYEMDNLMINIFDLYYKEDIINEIINDYKMFSSKYNIANNNKLIIEKLNNKKKRLLELYLDDIISKNEYQNKNNMIIKEMSLYDYKNECSNNNKIDKKIILEIFNNDLYKKIIIELIDKIYVSKKNNIIYLEIHMNTGDRFYASSDKLGRRYHLIDNYTTSNGSI